ncbi:Membrane protein TerC, possibly involved in tellurium resistance [Salinimicrobium catena]|uniref:Membrane protein TerC, possibly involved in tellurium resistance n=1 Tax=Salinimicrobium catena TaxID=390640 RepID=A0A1H5JU41_9FLAO|nr:TerC family protein [Salinimicrobium catena]SDK90514.1 Membrane protein TerC, possibly involved in tellurium resistance [Salinimicrobium catena]SEE56095.1 Membrane protein TerC, possibly involved in tellurium resistance [Salinimicrobium catena]
MEMFLQVDTWVALLTLTFMEIVLGIDNIIFISIVAGKLPEDQQKKARIGGLALALIFRILLLFSITWLIGLTQPVFTLFGIDFSWRDIILAAGGIFLIVKSVLEIHEKVEVHDIHKEVTAAKSFTFAILQIVMLDVIFSFDSILTAVGLTEEITLMIIAVTVSIIIMMIFARAVGDFVNKYPTVQILALSFLILIGFMLVMEGLEYHVPKGYIYFAVFFSLVIEMLNIRFRKKQQTQQKEA